MKKIRSAFSRHRLLINVLALVFVLGTMVAPAAADDGMVIEGTICANGCVNWNQQQGCIDCQHCCSGSSGWSYCYQVANNLCS
jgi:hypothetical protein